MSQEEPAILLFSQNLSNVQVDVHLGLSVICALSISIIIICHILRVI